MPQSYYSNFDDPESIDLDQSLTPIVCQNPLTPPTDQADRYGPVRSVDDERTDFRDVSSTDNTAAAMAEVLEHAVYLSPAATPPTVSGLFVTEDREKMELVFDDRKDGIKTPSQLNMFEACDGTECVAIDVLSAPGFALLKEMSSLEGFVGSRNSPAIGNNDTAVDAAHTCHQRDGRTQSSDDYDVMAHSQGLAPTDLQFNRSTTFRQPTFSTRRLLPEYPSHVFQPFSRYSGTQRSDRQIYNVDVTILTVDIAQCSITGYLLIRGLTPEHDTLQTYFTGEIIGSQSKSMKKQLYTFRTSNSAWGATEKTDLTHWAKFPAWRSLSSHAKKDIKFAYPIDGGNWWEQENVFMRWKEHFLVPDHKTKSIAGASFEGFYYICLNQIQGKISGIYYHSKSEKFQQLELKHEGHPEIFNRGITPSLEFR